ncbi:MAG TPA: uroporphyrinogen decarboxylase family protein [bacterium]|nr:uroporphyrinogen decarboxylase family protein [bacterium]
MTDTERFHATMEYQKRDRAIFWSWGGWPETIERWKQECPEFESKLAPFTTLNQRQFFNHWFFPHPPFEKKVIEENDQHILYINHEGILMREMKNNPKSSMPQFVRFPVETREDFRKFWKQRMQPDLETRIGPDWRKILLDIRNKPYPFIIISDRWGGFFGPLRNLVGVEKLCMLFYDDPAFVEEMMDANADFIIAMMNKILDVVSIDAFGFWEDMAYKTGPLISPDLARKYMLPRYRKVVDFLKKRSVKYIGLDSDGDITTLIPVWIDAGLNYLYPFEVQAGMDVIEVRKKFGKHLRIWGGVDKRAIAMGKNAIDREIQRLTPLIEEGGYIPHPDHSIPPDVSFENYLYYLEKISETCEKIR